MLLISPSLFARVFSIIDKCCDEESFCYISDGTPLPNISINYCLKAISAHLLHRERRDLIDCASIKGGEFLPDEIALRRSWRRKKKTITLVERNLRLIFTIPWCYRNWIDYHCRLNSAIWVVAVELVDRWW